MAEGKGDSDLPADVPEWAIKLVRRLVSLPDGRHVIIFTKEGSQRDLTVVPAGKVEQL